MGNVTAGQLIIGGAIAYFMSRDVKASTDKKNETTTPSVESVHEDNKTEPEVSEVSEVVPPADSAETNPTQEENVLE